jgi:hypothetical protein
VLPSYSRSPLLALTSGLWRLAPSSVPPGRVRQSLLRGLLPSRSISNSLPSRQCAAFIEKSELTTGGGLPACLRCLPPQRGPFPSSVIPSRGDDEGPPLGSDHPSSVYVLPSRLTRRVVHSTITDHSLPFASCSLLCPYTGGSLQSKRIRRRNSAKKGGETPSTPR